MTSAREVMDAATEALRGRCPEPVDLDARFALAHVLGLSPAELAAQPSRDVSDEERRQFDALIAERATGRPLAQVLGEWEFHGVPLYVTADVLTPRPATETLVEVALSRLPKDSTARILDLGVGSGAIAIAIARERPNVRVVGVDVSAPALDVCRRNIERHGLGDRMNLLRADFRAEDFGVAVDVGKFDMIVSNPPYIALDDPDVEEHVRKFEPAISLFDSERDDGLGAYVRIIASTLEPERFRGRMVFEVGEAQASGVRALIPRPCDVQVHKDLAGIERVVEVTTPQ